MTWETLAASQIINTLGWTLAYSIWQIGLVAVVLFVLLRLVNPSAANFRYAVSVIALLISLALPVVTFVQLTGADKSVYASSTISSYDHANRSRDSDQIGDRSDIAATDRVQRGQAVRSTTALYSAVREFLGANLGAAMPFAVLLWFLGVAIFSCRLAGGLWQLRSYRQEGIEPLGVDWTSRFSLLCQSLKIGRRVELLRSTIVKTPIAIGIFRPFIIVPASAFLQISPSELETIIAHELIHIRRYDPLVNMVQSVVEALFFYHPCIWWISAKIRLEREFSADNAVIEAFGDSHIVYANALANLEEIRHLANKQMPRIATAANGGNLMQRIQRILKIKTEMKRANSAWSAGLAFVLISAVLTMVFSFNSTSLVNAQSKTGNRKVAIGFVSIPPLDRSENSPKDSASTAKILVEVLRAHKIPAIGFLNGSQVSDGEKMYPVRAEIAKMWRDEGFEIGVGGYQHIWFYDTPFDDYVANTEKNINIANKIVGDQGQSLHYFSYPYLNTGKSSEDRDRFESWLQGRGLTSVKYTVDNNEWMYSYVYDLARNDNDVNLMKETRMAFLDYMSKMFDHYETYSKVMFGRDIAQTMVLTPSRLVADSGHDLFGMIENRGYTFVSMSDAQSDPAYQTAEDFAGKSGISWFERWRMKQGQPLLDEPKVEPAVQKIWETKEIVKDIKKKVS